VDDLSIGIGDTQLLITTHTTLGSEFFRSQIQELTTPLYLIADEVHGLGSEDRRTGLLETYDYRLGLSATPRRHYDEEGTAYLLEYFGDIVHEYGLEKAIPQYLTPYDYHPEIVEMTAEEFKEYKTLSKRLAQAAADNETDEEVVERLAMKRANTLKSAQNKYRALQKILNQLNEPDHLLVYTNPQQIDTVQELLNDNGIVQHKFTYHENETERDRLLERFDVGEYDALVAMRCLDEGVDVPSTRQAVLMSNSGNPMQFIQRRGRVLRHALGKNRAHIFDMIVVPSMEPTRQVIESERGILEKELRRFEEFASNARNEAEARNIIDRVRIAYEL